MIQKPAGIKGKRRQERIDPKEINVDFVVNFPLTTFQKKAIELVYFMRAVKTSQIIDILGYSERYARRELLTLHLNRFLHRKFPAKKRNQKGTNEGYFLLDDAGAIFISGYYELPMKEVKWNKRDNLIKPDKLQHTFKICDVRASIEKDARKKGHKIINCVSDRHLYFPFKYEENNFVLRPDMYFDYITDKKQYSYFVEVDLGTMAMTANSFKTNSFDNKVYYYESFKLSEAYKEYLDVFPRILVITVTTERAEKLAQAVRKKQKTKIEFLFTSFTLWNEYPTGPIFLKTNGEHTSIFE